MNWLVVSNKIPTEEIEAAIQVLSPFLLRKIPNSTTNESVTII